MNLLLDTCTFIWLAGSPGKLSAPAQQAMGISFVPATERPVLVLDAAGYPLLDGISFRDCWIVTPVYADAFRPRIREEVPLEMIRDWQVLRMRWE